MKDMKGYVPDHWVLDEALTLIRTLQPETRRFNYHLCLGGGVLNNGESKKDLDLFFLPMNNGKDPDLPGLHDWLCGLWGDGEKLGKDNGQYEDDEGDYSLKVKFTYSGLRIDVFAIGGVATEEKPSKEEQLTYADYQRAINGQPGTIIQYHGTPAAPNDAQGIYQGITRTTEPMWRPIVTQQLDAGAAIDWQAIARTVFNPNRGDR